jgi:hypothetical protein
MRNFHLRKKSLRAAIIIIFFGLGFCFIFLLPAFNYLSGYLSKSDHVNANILIVEGWLPEYALELATKEFQNNHYDHIVTTGLKTANDYRRISADGYVIFYTPENSSAKAETGTHSIEIEAFSELGGDNRAHFNLYMNDSLTADFLAVKRKKTYKVNWKGKLNTIDSIMLQFDNDRWGELGDRNLFVKEIKIDKKTTIPNIANSHFIVTTIDGRRTYDNYYSNAVWAKEQLRLLGIDSTFITAAYGEKVVVNRTLTSALAFRDWLQKSQIKVTGINIISLGAHARRTWMIYNKILDEKYSIGTISIPDYYYSNSLSYRLFKNIREALGIIYYWFILIPYGN